jgi:D-aminoacyl-tRNA deacylase
MRALLQRVSNASVTVDDSVTGSIERGLLVFLGIASTDTAEDVGYLAEKIPHLRIFHDDQGRMNRSVVDVGGAVLLVSQFTLYASTRKGRRPGFDRAAPPEAALPLYKMMEKSLAEVVPLQTGVFGARMKVDLVNDGPVTIMLESDERPSRRG